MSRRRLGLRSVAKSGDLSGSSGSVIPAAIKRKTSYFEGFGESCNRRRSENPSSWVSRLTLQRPFHQPLEEELLRAGEGDDARGDDDDVDGREIGPGPLTLTALGGGEDD